MHIEPPVNYEETSYSQSYTENSYTLQIKSFHELHVDQLYIDNLDILPVYMLIFKVLY